MQIGDGGANNGSLSPGSININTTTYGGDATVPANNWNGQLVINRTSDITIANDLFGQSASAGHNTGGNNGGLLLASTNTAVVSITGSNSGYFAPFTANGGVLKFTSDTQVGNALLIDIGGGTSTGIVKIDSGATPMNIMAPITLGSRAAATTPHFENVSGNNVLNGSSYLIDPLSPLYGCAISLYEGGNQGIVQSDAGVGNFLTISGNIKNNAGASFTSPRSIVLQGTGDGEVSGIIGGGTNPAALNVVKSGSGTWTLSNAANTYTGTTTVNGGTLKIGATGNISTSPKLIVNTGAILDVASVSGGFNLASGQTLAGLGNVNGDVSAISGGAFVAPGDVGATGTLTLNQSLNLAASPGNVLKFDLRQTPTDPLGNDLLVVTSNFASSSTNKIEFNVSLLQPTINNLDFPLVQYGSFSGNPLTDFTLTGISAGRQTISLLNNSLLKEIYLHVSGGTPMALTWVGGLNSNAWNINTTPNWSGSQTFFDGDTVTFNDTGSNVPDINLVGKLSPGSVTFNNSAKDYKLSGSGYISGGVNGITQLIKNGTGKVILANSTANDFVGNITINAGTLQIGDGVNSGAIPGTANILNNGSLIINRPDDTNMTNVISGTGTFVKQSANILTLSGTNTYTGATTVQAGTLTVTVLANGGANSNIGASTNAAANLVLNGGTLQYTGAAVTTDRLFTLGTGASAATIDSSGTGRLNFTNAGAMAFTGSGARTLTLTGTNSSGETTGTNILAAVIGDGTGGATSLHKTGTGFWTLSNNNTYTGGTIIDGGLLWAYNQSPAGGGNGIPQTYSNHTALGAPTNTVTINSGGTLAIWGNPYATWTTTLAGVTLNGGTLMADDGHHTLAAPVNFTTDSTIIARYWDKDFLITGNVTGTGNLTINASTPPNAFNIADIQLWCSDSNRKRQQLDRYDNHQRRPTIKAHCKSAMPELAACLLAQPMELQLTPVAD